MTNAESSIARLRPGFRACYNEALAKDPALEGCANLTVRIAADGSVTSAEAMAREGLSDATIDCRESLLRSARFEAPGDPGATLNVPITFVRRTRAAEPAHRPLR